MPHNKPSWSRLMKSPDFHDKYKLNTNPAHGRTYIPKDNSAPEPLDMSRYDRYYFSATKKANNKDSEVSQNNHSPYIDSFGDEYSMHYPAHLREDDEDDC